jgi:hypothetical protein
MKILLDECLPLDFRYSFPGAYTAQWAGLKGTKNGELLRAAEAAGYDVLLTVDQGIPRSRGQEAIDHPDSFADKPTGRPAAPAGADPSGAADNPAWSGGCGSTLGAVIALPPYCAFLNFVTLRRWRTTCGSGSALSRAARRQAARRRQAATGVRRQPTNSRCERIFTPASPTARAPAS